VDGIYAPGDDLPIARADLKIAGMEKSKPISSSDKEVKLVLPLKRGPADLQTWFRDADGKELCGAYCVYVSGPDKKK
jgi:arylsulfatase